MSRTEVLDVNFETGQIVAPWDDSKGKRDELIFIPDSPVDLLRAAWKNVAEGPLERKMLRRALYVPFAELQVKAGIHLECEESYEHIDACHVYGFHAVKRAVATNKAATLSPVQLRRLMKHTVFATHQDYIDSAKQMTERPDVFVPDVLSKKSGSG